MKGQVLFSFHLREISGTVTIHKDRKQVCGARGGGRECFYLMRTAPTGEDINVLETGGGNGCQQCDCTQCH